MTSMSEKNMKKQAFRLQTLGVCIAVLLTGCDGGNDGSSPSPVPPSPPTPTVKMLAMDGFSVVKPGVRSLVDVSNFVRGDQIQLTDATVTGEGCGQPDISGLGLMIKVHGQSSREPKHARAFRSVGDHSPPTAIATDIRCDDIK